MSKSIQVNEKQVNEKQNFYELFEKQTNKKAIHKGKETSYFLAWYENLNKKKDNSIKFIVRYFPYDDKMICFDYQVKESEVRFDSDDNLIWSLTPNSKIFYLKEIAHTILGVNTYYVVSSHKNSIPFKLCKENDDLIDYGCNSFDEYNKLHSDILHKNLKIISGKLYSKWTIYFVIFLFVFMITLLPFFPSIFLKFYGV